MLCFPCPFHGSTCTWRMTFASRLLQASSLLTDSFATPSAMIRKILGRLELSGPRTIGLLLWRDVHLSGTKKLLKIWCIISWGKWHGGCPTFQWGHTESQTCGRPPLCPRWVGASWASEEGSHWRWRTLAGTSWPFQQQRCSFLWHWHSPWSASQLPG